MRNVLVLTAVLPEARALARALRLAKCPSDLPFWQNDQFGGGLSLACIGIAGTNLSRVIPPTTAKLIVMAGVAGALSPDLQRGDVVLNTTTPLPAPLPHLNHVHIGQIHTAQTLVTTPAQKAQLFNTTKCLAVDMETNIAHEFARKHNAAFVALRGISDTANESLDPKLLSLVDSDGNPRIAQAIAMLAVRPWKLAELIRLQATTNSAMTRIARILTELIASGWPEKAAVRLAHPPPT